LAVKWPGRNVHGTSIVKKSRPEIIEQNRNDDFFATPHCLMEHDAVLTMPDIQEEEEDNVDDDIQIFMEHVFPKLHLSKSEIL
jgi:hypothetical protein